MKTKLIISLPAFILIISSCASSYQTIDPSSLNYSNRQNCNDKLEVSYLYDIYSMADNRKYARKEKSNNYRTIAVKIKNLTDTSRFITTDNFRIYVNDREMTMVNKAAYLNVVHQFSGLYLLHALWGPWKVESWSDSNGQSGSKTTYYPLGFIVGVGNMIVASLANSKHKNEIMENEIFGKTINPHGSITGIIILNYTQYDPLVFKYLDK